MHSTAQIKRMMADVFFRLFVGFFFFSLSVIKFIALPPSIKKKMPRRQKHLFVPFKKAAFSYLFGFFFREIGVEGRDRPTCSGGSECKSSTEMAVKGGEGRPNSAGERGPIPSVVPVVGSGQKVEN